ncbi:MAG: hypothetical protein QXZ06_00285, partial [Candidatus Jordarchaeales archaeon]
MAASEETAVFDINFLTLFSSVVIGFNDSEKESERALKLAEEINSKDGKAICYFTSGKIYSKFSDMIYQTKAKE